jgi:hypothetical protein
VILAGTEGLQVHEELGVGSEYGWGYDWTELICQCGVQRVVGLEREQGWAEVRAVRWE